MKHPNKMNKFDDTFLARWLSGELSSEEDLAFKGSKEYIEYQKIADFSNRLKTPEFDEKILFSKISKTTIDKPKVRRLNTTRVLSIAASIVLLLGVFLFQNSRNCTFSSGYGDQLAVLLPDGSEAILNANSNLKFNKKYWSTNRTVTLEGEAYFKVKKGSNFKVQTNEGYVQVLGTEFNVNSSINYLEVQCYTGKVKVTNKDNKETILTKGESTRTLKDNEEKWGFNTGDPFWLKGVSSFNKTPFNSVIVALENQFNIKIENADTYKNQRFTGNFNNKNRDNALKTVLTAMSIEYTIKNNTVTIKTL